MLLVHSLFSVLLFLAIGAEAAPARKAERGTRTVTGRAVTTTARTSGDLQTYNLGIGGVYAPPVTANNGLFYVNGVPSLTLYDAEVASCTAQLNACTASFSISITDKLTCQNKQVFDCIAAGQTASTAYTSSAAAASASSSSSSAAAARSSSLAASVAAYSASVGAAASASAYSASVAAAANVAASASAYSASVAAAASLSASASAYSASVAAAANVAASASAFSASAAAYSASVALAANAPKSTSSAAPISSVAASSTSSVAGTPTTAPVVTVAGNLQTFTGAIGGVAPAVTANADGSFTMSGTNYPILLNALTQSCYSQAATCLNHASITDQPACWGSQVNACLAAANTIASNYASAGVAYSASVASANLAKATSVRTVAGDLQTFTGSLGGIPAPAVTGSPQNWWMNGLYFYNLIDALDQSCWVQQGLCEAAAVKAGNTFELTINNCDNVQTPACLSNAKNIVANYGHSSSAAPASSTSSVAAAPTNNAASASAYSASSAAAASASAASASSAAAASASAAAAASASAAQASSAAAYSASVAQSASAYSASSAAAASSASAYSASSAAAYSASVAASASAYSASSAAAASASAYSASSAAAYSASVAASAAAYSSSVSAAQAQSTSVPSGWAYASPACIAEGTSGRALTGASTSGPDMTWQKCTSYCSSNGFLLAGLEYSSECYCGNVLTNGASLNRGSSQCNMQASGNNAQVAGGPGALTLFVSNNLDYSKYLPDLTGMIATIPSGWQQATSGGQGICMVEGSSGRALVAASTASDDMTIGKCIDFCASKGAQYAGLEYSRECYCGNDIVNGASLQKTAPCDMQCAGAPGTICGGPNLLSVYTNTNLVYTNTQVGAYSKQGCIQEVAGRALTGASIATNDMTLEKCTNFCQQGGFDFAGLEYAGECYCGNGMSNGASFNAWSTECKMPCSGNSNEICGGPNAISLYSTAKGAQLIGA